MNEYPILFKDYMIFAIRNGWKSQTRRVIKPQPPEGMQPYHIYGPEIYEPAVVRNGVFEPGNPIYGVYDEFGEWGAKCPYGMPRSILWVKETWNADVDASLELGGQWFNEIDKEWRLPKTCVHTYYRADGAQHIVNADYPNPGDVDLDSAYYGSDFLRPSKWMSPIFMPKWACRMRLKVTNVRVQQIQDITPEDALHEGMRDFLPDWYEYVHSSSAKDDVILETFAEEWDRINAKRGHPWSNNDWVWVVDFEHGD